MKYYRSDTIGLLARIYASEGRIEDGRALLRACLDLIERDPQCSPRGVASFIEPLVKTLRKFPE